MHFAVYFEAFAGNAIALRILWQKVVLARRYNVTLMAIRDLYRIKFVSPLKNPSNDNEHIRGGDLLGCV